LAHGKDFLLAPALDLAASYAQLLTQFPAAPAGQAVQRPTREKGLVHA
jgi:hypothetical protein